MPGLVTSIPTAGAQRALGLAQLVNKVFAETRVRGAAPGHPGFRVEMSGPGASSTADARRALQYIRLVPFEGAGAIEIATSDPNGAVELRAFDSLRAGGAPGIDREDYESLMTKIAQFFQGQGIDTRVVASRIPAPAPRVRAKPWTLPAPASEGPGVIAVALVIAFVAAALVFVFVGR